MLSSAASLQSDGSLVLPAEYEQFVKLTWELENVQNGEWILRQSGCNTQ